MHYFYLTLKFLFCFIFLCACQTVTIKPQGGRGVYTSPPDYEKSHPFFLNGLIGSAKVNVSDICGSRNVVQMQTQKTFSDVSWPVIGSLLGASLGLAVGMLLSQDMNLLTESEAVTTVILGWAGLLIGSLYTPKTAKVWCGRDL